MKTYRFSCGLCRQLYKDFVKKDMQKGFNTDIEIDGKNFHVQTEDWGLKNPFLVTRIFSEGAVLKSVKTPYTVLDLQAIGLAMKEQHQAILDWLLSSHQSA